MDYSHQYLEIEGKSIPNPFREKDMLHGVELNRLFGKLYDSGATERRNFDAILMTAIECEISIDNDEKAEDVYQYIMVKLGDLGVLSDQVSH